MDPQFVSWPDIESFHNVRKAAEKYPHLLGGEEVIAYRPKVKLHGTNAAVQLFGDTVQAQSRERLITPESDNMGFARWVKSVEGTWRAVRDRVSKDVILFGEWCGPGIMRGTAINKAPNKVFAVFAAMELPSAEGSTLYVEPAVLMDLVEDVPDVHVIDWYGPSIEIPVLGLPEVVSPILDAINQEVLAVEACDPWVKKVFGVEGVGEGLVYYPRLPTRKKFSDLAFKAKGEKHKVVEKTKPAQIDPSVATSIDEYVQMVLAEARLEQGARIVAGGDLVFDKKNLGPFIGWIGKDVEKETQAELSAANLTWKQVQKTVSDAARKWFLSKA